jgi:hypothetical protein
MFSFLKKKVNIPTGEEKTIEAAETWRVSWMSRHDRYAHDTRLESEFFFSEEDANNFANSLRNAFKLIRHSSGNTVSIEKNK